MAQGDLRLITKLVQHYRDETSCVTTGEHRGIALSGTARPLTQDDLVDLIGDLAAFSAVQGWNFAALVQRSSANGQALPP